MLEYGRVVTLNSEVFPVQKYGTTYEGKFLPVAGH
jgi:hypothetical protein